VKCTLVALIRDPFPGSATASMYAAPANHSIGPRRVSMPFLVICMSAS
jgi:hypothetical protein